MTAATIFRINRCWWLTPSGRCGCTAAMQHANQKPCCSTCRMRTSRRGAIAIAWLTAALATCLLGGLLAVACAPDGSLCSLLSTLLAGQHQLLALAGALLGPCPCRGPRRRLQALRGVARGSPGGRRAGGRLATCPWASTTPPPALLLCAGLPLPLLAALVLALGLALPCALQKHMNLLLCFDAAQPRNLQDGPAASLRPILRMSPDRSAPRRRPCHTWQSTQRVPDCDAASSARRGWSRKQSTHLLGIWLVIHLRLLCPRKAAIRAANSLKVRSVCLLLVLRRHVRPLRILVGPRPASIGWRPLLGCHAWPLRLLVLGLRPGSIGLGTLLSRHDWPLRLQVAPRPPSTERRPLLVELSRQLCPAPLLGHRAPPELVLLGTLEAGLGTLPLTPPAALPLLWWRLRLLMPPERRLLLRVGTCWPWPRSLPVAPLLPPAVRALPGRRRPQGHRTLPRVRLLVALPALPALLGYRLQVHSRPLALP